MSKILISWYAFNNDFEQKEGEAGMQVNKQGPTFAFHQYFYEGYDKHILLSSGRESDTKFEYLVNALNREYSGHLIEPKYMDIRDVIDLEQLMAGVEPLLLELKNDEVDIFISPGTPMMQTAWFLAHSNLDVQTRLIQTRPARFSKDRNQPERIFVNVSKNTFTSGAIIRQVSQRDATDDYVGPGILKTESVQPLYERAYQIAKAKDVTVLIQGETGTGKEHFARYIHNHSVRSESPFFPVNCSAMGDHLLESRLFGYKKGAFTGAEKDTPGIIELAQGGTVFLDEIGDISPYMQQSLLRVLQEKEIAPIGGNPKKVNVRFIAATNKDLLEMCESGKFRWDLYYRLSVVDLELPTLRERGTKEIQALISFFLKQKKSLFNASKTLEIPAVVMEKLLVYPFPGNIRELENLIERLYVFSQDGSVSLHHLPKRLSSSIPGQSLRLKDAEKMHILKVLELNKFNKRKTARDMEVAYNTLDKKMKEYEIGVE